jgi:hypothetical protein
MAIAHSMRWYSLALRTPTAKERMNVECERLRRLPRKSISVGVDRNAQTPAPEKFLQRH